MRLPRSPRSGTGRICASRAAMDGMLRVNAADGSSARAASDRITVLLLRGNAAAHAGGVPRSDGSSWRNPSRCCVRSMHARTYMIPKQIRSTAAAAWGADWHVPRTQSTSGQQQQQQQQQQRQPQQQVTAMAMGARERQGSQMHAPRGAARVAQPARCLTGVARADAARRVEVWEVA